MIVLDTTRCLKKRGFLSSTPALTQNQMKPREELLARKLFLLTIKCLSILEGKRVGRM